MLHQIKAQQFYTDLDLYQQCYVIQKIEEFKDFSRPLNDFPVLFKAYLIFKDFSRKPSKFKYFSSLCETCNTLANEMYLIGQFQIFATVDSAIYTVGNLTSLYNIFFFMVVGGFTQLVVAGQNSQDNAFPLLSQRENVNKFIIMGISVFKMFILFIHIIAFMVVNNFSLAPLMCPTKTEFGTVKQTIYPPQMNILNTATCTCVTPDDYRPPDKCG